MYPDVQVGSCNLYIGFVRIRKLRAEGPSRAEPRKRLATLAITTHSRN